MKREVKFRAYVETYNGKEMVNDWCFLNLKDNHFNAVDLTNERPDIGEVYAVMQSTGLKDKKGKEIYEGDILQTSTGIASVVWEGAGWALKSTGSDAVDWENWSNYSAYEVIGNIYESNHELINYKETKDEYIFNKPQRNNEYI